MAKKTKEPKHTKPIRIKVGGIPIYGYEETDETASGSNTKTDGSPAKG